MTIESITAQDFSNGLLAQYDNFREPGFTHRRIKHADLEPLIKKLPGNFKIKQAGRSYQGRAIHLLSIGSGEISILLWSQMHGNEATATMALFDIFNYVGRSDSPEVKKLLSQVTLHFIPMLNPDGAELFERRTAQGIDMNRDALSLQCPESKILKSVRDSLQADWGFNLHDQRIYYNVGQTASPATISFLAPAYNFEKEVNATRGNAMKVIARMNKVLQEIIPGQVGKYDDTFEPRAFGDNIQKWGTSTILIESGGMANDPEKQAIRKLNFIAILTAIKSIGSRQYIDQDINEYWEIPFNSSNLNDVIFRDITIKNPDGRSYLADIAIRRQEFDHRGKFPLYYQGKIEDLGDLSTQYGYQDINGAGLEYMPGMVYPGVFGEVNTLSEQDIVKLLKQGYTYIKFEQRQQREKYNLPFDVIGDTAEPAEIPVVPELEQSATFLLTLNGAVKYAVINGFVHDIEQLMDLKGHGWVYQ